MYVFGLAECSFACLYLKMCRSKSPELVSIPSDELNIV